MTNGEKFKTAQERAEACKEFMKDHKEYDEMPYIDAAFSWLDLEAEEEKPLPCPFCGGEINIYHCGDNGQKSFGLACFCGYRIRAKSESDIANKIAAHNRVAKAVQNQDKYCEFCRPEMSTLHCTARYISESAKKHIEKIERILNGCCDTSHAIAVIGEAKCIIESFRNDERKYRD